jgi:hypothetical protein
MATDSTGGDVFGNSVTISGSTIAVGAPGWSTDAGAIYLFTLGKKGWAAAGKLTQGGAYTEFGNAVALNGTELLASTLGNFYLGAAYVYSKGAKGWKQTAKYGQSDGALQDYFGFCVGTNGKTFAVGSPDHANNNGAVYLFP